jgi:membrane fusion protein (multidrug efflux system)
MPADAKLALRTAETAKAPHPQPERPADTPVTRRDAPSELPERPAEKPPQKTQSPQRPWIRRALFALLPLVLIAGSYWYVAGGKVMSTDDAYVEADTVGISTDVPGIVDEIDVTNNQHVDPGQVLYRLDPQQFQIALDNAKANLAQTALTIDAMKQDYQRMLSDAAAQQGQVALDQTTYARAEHQRQLGQGGAAHSDARARRYQRQEPAAAARRHERRSRCRYRPRARLTALPDRAVRPY